MEAHRRVLTLIGPGTGSSSIVTEPSGTPGPPAVRIFGGMCVPCSPLPIFKQAIGLSVDPIWFTWNHYETSFNQILETRLTSVVFAQSPKGAALNIGHKFSFIVGNYDAILTPTSREGNVTFDGKDRSRLSEKCKPYRWIVPGPYLTNNPRS